METISDAMGDLVLMIILAVVFVYLVMVAQFQSLLSPFIVFNSFFVNESPFETITG